MLKSPPHTRVPCVSVAILSSIFYDSEPGGIYTL